jgi:hypothetical protein
MVRKKQKQVPAKAAKPLSRAKLTSLAAKFAKRRITLAQTPVMELTPRHPYDAAGSMDFENARFWSSAFGQIWLDKETTASGTRNGIVYFTAPADGTYLIAANFFSPGHTTLTLTGPWGDSSENAMPHVQTAALALWTATAGPGRKLSFNVACTGVVTANILGFQVFRLS